MPIKETGIFFVYPTHMYCVLTMMLHGRSHGSRDPVDFPGTFQSHSPRTNRSAEDQPLHSFESRTGCRPGRTRDSRRRRTRDNSAISATSGGCFGTIPLEFLRFLRWNPSSTRLAMHRIHLGILRSRLAMRAPKGVSSTVAGSGNHRTLGDGLEGTS